MCFFFKQCNIVCIYIYMPMNQTDHSNNPWSCANGAKDPVNRATKSCGAGPTTDAPPGLRHPVTVPACERPVDRRPRGIGDTDLCRGTDLREWRRDFGISGICGG